MIEVSEESGMSEVRGSGISEIKGKWMSEVGEK